MRGRRTGSPRSLIAVDWSGAKAGERAHLWLAEARDGRLARLHSGLSRTELVRALIEHARREPRTVVGLDFAFSFPRWFLEQHELGSARRLWEHVAREGEGWLARPAPPFWGRPGCPRPEQLAGRSPWRATESDATATAGIRPKSVFQIGGAGAVGTGSLRGMPHLVELQDAGFSIWPFDRARLPLVVEIYPRYLTGPVNKSSVVARSLHLQAHHAREERHILSLAESSEDAFDAAVSAACMQRFAGDFARLARERRSRIDRLEGRIWRPLRDPLFERW